MSEAVRNLLQNLTILFLVVVVYDLKRKLASYDAEIKEIKHRLAVHHSDIGAVFKCVGITKTCKKETSSESKD